MAVDIVIQETIDLVDITVNPNIIEVNVTRTSGGGGSQTLAQTLVLGNTSGGENILVNDADAIELENGSKLSQGIVDAGTGGNKGIALTCAVGFEWKFEAGEAYLTDITNGNIRLKQYALGLPSVNDDITKGYAAGSYWYQDQQVSYYYICTDPTEGAAIWEQRYPEINLQQVTDEGNTTTKSIIIDNDSILTPKSFIVNNTTIGGYGELNSEVMLIVSPSGTTSTFANGALTLGDLNQDITNTVNFSVVNDTISYGVGFILNSSAIMADISLIYHPDYFIPQTAFNSPVNFYIPYKLEGTYTLATLDDIPAAGVTSVGLTMPSAFTVTNSPITSSGDIAVTGAGAVSQYVRGDGTLANFPTSSGGGSSLSFYLNGSVSQGTFGGVTFKEMDRTPILGAGTDFTINANGYIQSFITDAGVPNQLEIPAGNWNFETYFSASSGGGSPSFYVELYKWNGTTLSLIASNSATPENITGGTSIDLYVSALAVPQTALLATDRLAVRIYVTHSGRTITLHTEDNHLCQVITTFSTGLTALNGLTAQVQNLAVGTTGTDFAINSTTSTHTFNLPTASASNRGALSSTDWTTFNNKQNTSTLLVDSIDKAILRNNYFWFLPYIISNGALSSFANSERISSASFILLLNSNLLRGMVTFSTTATAGTIASMRRNDSLQLQGYECKFTRKIQFNSNVSGQRFFCGISKGNQFAIATNVEPNTLTDIVGVCQLSTSTNMHIVYNDASGTATTSDLGSSYPCNDSQYNYYITVEQTTTSYIITVERVTVATGASISTSLTTSTNIPNYATGVIQLFTFITNNATASIASYLDGGCIGSFKN